MSEQKISSSTSSSNSKTDTEMKFPAGSTWKIEGSVLVATYPDGHTLRSTVDQVDGDTITRIHWGKDKYTWYGTKEEYETYLHKDPVMLMQDYFFLTKEDFEKQKLYLYLDDQRNAQREYDKPTYNLHTYKKIVAIYNKCAPLGHIIANNELGKFYLGFGDPHIYDKGNEETRGLVKKDVTKGIECLKRAIESKQLDEINTVADIKYRAILVPILTKAKAEAYRVLGKLYASVEKVEGLDRDPKKGLYYMQMAADLGDMEAQKILGMFYFTIEKDEEKANKYFTKATQSKLINSAVNWSYTYTYDSSLWGSEDRISTTKLLFMNIFNISKETHNIPTDYIEAGRLNYMEDFIKEWNELKKQAANPPAEIYAFSLSAVAAATPAAAAAAPQAAASANSGAECDDLCFFDEYENNERRSSAPGMKR